MSRSHLGLYLGLCLALFFSAINLRGQSIKTIVQAQVEAGQPFTITYQITGGNGDVRVTSAPELGNLQLLYGPAYSSRAEVTVVNGHVRQSSSSNVTYTVLANEPGTYKVSGPTVSISGKTLKGETSSIKVVAGSRGSSAPTERQMAGQRGATQEATFRLVAIPERTTIYEQEPLMVTYRMRGTQRYRIINYAAAAHQGFVSQNVQEDSHIPFFSERIGGVNYLSINLISEILYPVSPGEQSISSASAIIAYTIADQEDFFLSQDKQEELRSSAVKVQVKPLPQEGRPEHFSGAVGQFDIRYELDKQPWRTNEARALKVIISGVGNLKTAKSPTIALPDALELYDPIEHSEQVYRDGEVRAVRTIEYSLIPRKTGRVQLPALEFSYFDPKSGRYHTAVAEAQTVEITPGRSIERQSGEAMLQHTATSEDTPYDIMPQGSGSSSHHFPAIGLVGYLGLNLLVIALGFGVYRYLAHRRSLRADAVSYKATRAGKVASKRLAMARQRLEEGATEAFYTELLKAIWGYLGDKLRLPQSALSRADMAVALEHKGVSSQVITELTSIIDTIEYARYAPARSSQCLREVYSRASQLIEAIESRK